MSKLTHADLNYLFEKQLGNLYEFVPKNGHRPIGTVRERKRVIEDASQKRHYGGKIPVEAYRLLHREKRKIIRVLYENQEVEADIPFIIVVSTTDGTGPLLSIAGKERDVSKEILDGHLYGGGAGVYIIGNATLYTDKAPIADFLTLGTSSHKANVEECLSLFCQGYAQDGILIATGARYAPPKLQKKHGVQKAVIPVVTATPKHITLGVKKQTDIIEGTCLFYEYKISLETDAST